MLFCALSEAKGMIIKMDELFKQLTLLIVDDARENINLLAEILKANL